MAFKRVEKKKELQDLPLLSDYLEGLSPKEEKKIQGSIFLVEGITIAKSGKGYMLNFNAFCTFLFKKSNEADLLREYMADDSIGIPCIEIDSTVKYSFHFGIDSEICSRINKKTESMLEVVQLGKKSSEELPLNKEF